MKVSDTSNVNVTDRALHYIQMVNYAKNRGMTFKQIANAMKLSERTVRRYFYGIHSVNTFQESKEQIRVGACVPIDLIENFSMF
jgi:AraC-like DNA-binding protein